MEECATGLTATVSVQEVSKASTANRNALGGPTVNGVGRRVSATTTLSAILSPGRALVSLVFRVCFAIHSATRECMVLGAKRCVAARMVPTATQLTGGVLVPLGTWETFAKRNVIKDSSV